MAKTTDNDKKIRELKELIQEQIDNLPKVTKDFKTNLILDFQDKQYNLNVTSLNILSDLMIRLYLYKTAIDALKLDNYLIGGFTVDDWIADITTMIEIHNRQDRLNKLRQNYKKIDSLMSDTAKTEDFLNAVEEFLKG